MEEEIREVPVMEDALSQESAILDIFEKEGLKNPKKVKKLALRLLKEATNRIQIKLLTDIAAAKNSAAQAEYYIKVIRDCAVLIQQFIEDGCHGMIMMRHQVYPVVLDTREKWLTEKKIWHPDDEQEIQRNAVKNWMKEHGRNYFIGKVTLFPNFGFSGVPRIIVDWQDEKGREELERQPEVITSPKEAARRAGDLIHLFKPSAA